MEEIRNLIDLLEIETSAKEPDARRIMLVRNDITFKIRAFCKGYEYGISNNPWSYVRNFCAKYHLNYDDVCGKSRKRDVREARQVLHYLLKKNTSFSWAKIGDIVGMRDHATVMHSVTTVEMEWKYFSEKYDL